MLEEKTIEEKAEELFKNLLENGEKFPGVSIGDVSGKKEIKILVVGYPDQHLLQIMEIVHNIGERHGVIVNFDQKEKYPCSLDQIKNEMINKMAIPDLIPDIRHYEYDCKEKPYKDHSWKEVSKKNQFFKKPKRRRG